jgi:hypothetical protein
MKDHAVVFTRRSCWPRESEAEGFIKGSYRSLFFFFVLAATDVVF